MRIRSAELFFSPIKMIMNTLYFNILNYTTQKCFSNQPTMRWYLLKINHVCCQIGRRQCAYVSHGWAVANFSRCLKFNQFCGADVDYVRWLVKWSLSRKIGVFSSPNQEPLVASRSTITRTLTYTYPSFYQTIQFIWISQQTTKFIDNLTGCLIIFSLP